MMKMNDKEKETNFVLAFLSILCSKGTNTWKNAAENIKLPEIYEKRAERVEL